VPAGLERATVYKSESYDVQVLIFGLEKESAKESLSSSAHVLCALVNEIAKQMAYSFGVLLLPVQSADFVIQSVMGCGRELSA